MKAVQKAGLQVAQVKFERDAFTIITSKVVENGAGDDLDKWLEKHHAGDAEGH